MGLDMFLSEKVYIGANYQWYEIDGNLQLTKKYEKKTVAIPLDLARVSYIEQEVGYWRKANQIHAWFVRECQEGNDDCRDAYVSIEQLTQLLEDVRIVLSDHDAASDVLPPESGFFFGSNDYDKWYFMQLRNTRTILLTALKDYKAFAKVGIYLSFVYHSSW